MEPDGGEYRAMDEVERMKAGPNKSVEPTATALSVLDARNVAPDVSTGGVCGSPLR